MAKESGMRQRVSSLLRDNGFFVQAIENDVGDGVPDLFYTSKLSSMLAVNGWLELKKIKSMPKRATTSLFTSINHPLSVQQANWITLCKRNGTEANILVGFEREYFFVGGEHVDDFNEFTESRLRQFVITRQALVERLRSGDC